MQKIALTSFGVLAAFAIIASDPSQTPAQQLAPTIVLSSGELLEIGVDTDLVRPEFSWILTRDREFVNAQRSRFFQTRQTQAGTYTLDVSIQSEDRQRSEFHTFQIEVTQALPPSPFPTGSGSSVIVPNIMTEPSASINGTISVDPQGDLIKIDASRSTGPVERFLVDLDTSKDSNGDGIANNDTDNVGSSSERSGGPLYYYVKPLSTPRALSVTITGQGVTPVTQQFSVAFTGRTSVPTTPGSNGTTTIITETDGLTVRFTPDISADVLAGRSVLFEWDFGDNRKSLLKNAAHTYAQAGTYIVTIAVRDLASGQVLYSGSTQVSVTGQAPVEPEPEPTDEPSGIAWGTVFKLALVFGILLALGLAAFFILRKVKDLMAGKLQQKLEEVEGKYFEQPKTDAEIVASAPAPMALKKPETTDQVKQEVVTREKKREDFNTTKEQPIVNQSGPQPPWLKDAAAPQPKVEKPVATKPPAPAVTPPPPMPRTAPPVPPKPTPVPPPPPVQAPAPVRPVAPPSPVSAVQPQPVAPPSGSVMSPLQAPAVPPPPKVTPTPVPAPAPKPVQAPSVAPAQSIAPRPATLPVTKPASPLPVVTTPMETAKTTIENPTITPKTASVMPTQSKDRSEMTPEEREADRKRRKRQRYRQNKKERDEQAGSSDAPAQPKATDEKSADEPIILIQADSLMQKKPEDQKPQEGEKHA